MMVSGAVAVYCPRCRHELPPQVTSASGVTCAACGTKVEGDLFPALFRSDVTLLDQVVVADEATCFFHPERVAAVSCTRCGRFLCNLCRIPWAQEDICPACLEAVTTGEQGNALVSNRFHFDSLALYLTLFPMLTLVFTIFTAPMALGLALLTLGKECSIAPRSKIRFVLAILVSLGQIGAWITYFIYAVRKAGVG